MAKFKIGNYQGIKIDCWTAKDLVGLHHLMKQEGCPNSENLFSDTDKAIELDDVQRRISQKYHADKKSSADMLLHVNDKRLLLADAKFRLSNTRNLDSKEIAKKVSESKAMVASNYSFDNSFYVLLTKKATTPSNLNRLRRNVGNNPNYQFMDAVEFHKLFED